MGLFSGIGGILNDVTGASVANRKQYQYQKKLQELQHIQNKEILQLQQAYDTQMANTAVRRQMNDYLQAGINPAMVTASNGAGGGGSMGTGSGGAGSTSANSSGMTLTDIANTAVGAFSAIKNAQTGETQGKLNISQANKNDAETATIVKRLPYVEPQEKAKLNNIVADTILKRTNTAKANAGRWSELGLPIGEQVANVFNTPAKDPNNKANGKTIHWYGTRKDGR